MQGGRPGDSAPLAGCFDCVPSTTLPRRNSAQHDRSFERQISHTPLHGKFSGNRISMEDSMFSMDAGWSALKCHARLISKGGHANKPAVRIPVPRAISFHALPS